MKQAFYSHGKLLLTGEYLVLDNATALAIPTKKGQSMTIDSYTSSMISWKSYDHLGNCWFDFIFSFSELTTLLSTTKGNQLQHTLITLLQTAQQINPNFLSNQEEGYKIETCLEFDRSWGLGSSSTLINNIAQWAKVDPFILLEKGFGGSGYDIACAQHNTPITYIRNNNSPIIKNVSFDPVFKDNLFFIHLNKKQNSKESITHYRAQNNKTIDQAINIVNTYTSQFINCETLSDFILLIHQHESLISNIIKTATVKDSFFPDYTGGIKSLGGWGGDFILVTGTLNDMVYFKKKGFNTIISYSEMIYSK